MRVACVLAGVAGRLQTQTYLDQVVALITQFQQPIPLAPNGTWRARNLLSWKHVSKTELIRGSYVQIIGTNGDSNPGVILRLPTRMYMYNCGPNTQRIWTDRLFGGTRSNFLGGF